MPYKCLIVDDEPLARKVIKEYIQNVSGLEVAADLSSGIDAINFLKNNQVDVIFLDINMPKLTGFQLLENIDDPPLVVITTAYPEHAVEAFEVEVFDYLLKPISLDRFLKSCNRVIDQLGNKKNIGTQEIPYIMVKENKRLYKVNTAKIFYVKAFGDYVRIFGSDKTYITKERLQQFAALLPHNFLQVHRSFIVNLNHIQYIEGNLISIQDVKIPVSESYKQKLLERM